MDKRILIVVIIVLLVGVGIVAFMILQPEPEKPTIEQATAILAESIQNTLGLNSFTSTGDGVLEIRDGETLLFKVAIEDGQTSIINPFDFVDQDLSGVFTYNVRMNFEAMVYFVERVATPEELRDMIDILTTMRGLGEANISATMEMKSIDFDTYMKIVEITGLREIVAQVGGVFLAEMVMGEIEPHLGVWYKTPADPVMVEEMTVMFEKIAGLISDIFDVYYVREVLPNTEVNGVQVYNFILGLDLDKMRNVVISVVPLFAEAAEIDREEKERIIAEINENWPEIVEVIKVMEIDSRAYICQETRFTIKETMTANIDLHELVVILDPIMREGAEMTPEEIAEFNRMKEAVKKISLVTTMNVVYSDHNAVPAILPPAEYEVIEIPEVPVPDPAFPEPGL
ncbi:hypothetical protein M1O17_05145 [Dehalococcoidia bacterium]|nr:hypothetical protein [Dehalococcoidia bacterium]